MLLPAVTHCGALAESLEEDMNTVLDDKGDLQRALDDKEAELSRLVEEGGGKEGLMQR